MPYWYSMRDVLDSVLYISGVGLMEIVSTPSGSMRPLRAWLTEVSRPASDLCKPILRAWLASKPWHSRSPWHLPEIESGF